MAPMRMRSPSPVASNKRFKPNGPSNGLDLSSHFATNLLDDLNAQKLNEVYNKSEPYKYCVLDELFQDELLKKVKDECIGELSFTEKATDIYRVHQTGDLASLSFLEKQQLDLLPSLLTLRDCLYSPQFRTFLRTVTGCGPLSGTKQDMSVNSYKTGCHLLNHDDVIGSRRVSYILYMPLPTDKKWDDAWGGSLELYPVDENGEPKTEPSKKIPPAWNQFIFFEVQPGRSFHSVEEVVVGGGNDVRERLSISGWFHKAQEGEEGYEPESAERDKSSLEQLSAASPRQLTPYPPDDIPPFPSSPLSDEHVKFLSEYLNPPYLSLKTLSTLAKRFAEESSVQLHGFLNEPLTDRLRSGLRALDTEHALGPTRTSRVPSHTSGTAQGSSWTVRGPPHKQRYCVIAQPDSDVGSTSEGATALLRRLQDELFPSAAFRAWLALVSSLFPVSYAAEARRFRPGLDYTLATAEEDELRLDVVLGLTPEMEVEGKGKAKEEADWESGEWGGWECYMAAHEGDDDPAVYGSGTRRKAQNGSAKLPNGNEGGENGQTANDTDAEDDEEEDATLLTVQPGFNRLLLVLRDPGVLRFVKYVSALAPGSRWDISGEWEVGQVELEEGADDSGQDAEGEDDDGVES